VLDHEGHVAAKLRDATMDRRQLLVVVAMMVLAELTGGRALRWKKRESCIKWVPMSSCCGSTRGQSSLKAQTMSSARS
jgi:hypothetical protein